MGYGRNLLWPARYSPVGKKVMAEASAYYGIDSMLLHFPRALWRLPTISVFGPTDPATRLRPMVAPERVAFARLACSPCVHVNETPRVRANGLAWLWRWRI